MSVRIQSGTSVAAQPVTRADLIAYFHQAGCPRSRWRIGAEFEKFAVERTTGRHLRYEEPGGVGDILSMLCGHFHWQPYFNERGYLTALSRDGATVSLEPGGQLEFASSPASHVGTIACELHKHLEELTSVAGPRIAWLGAGVAPFSRVEDIPLMPRVRHEIMAAYLPRRSPTALHMMKATASTQITLDYADEGDAATKVTTALKLSPLVNALWANGAILAGTPTGMATYRGHVWKHMDPDRSGWLVELLQGGFSFERWVDYVLDVPMMFLYAERRYQPVGDRTFRDFLRDGIDGLFPTMEDWEMQVTTVFPEVRLKRFLEIRGADATPRSLALAVPAFWKGLLYHNLDAAARLAATIPASVLPAVHQQMYEHGLRATYQGRSLGEWCQELVDLSAEGLTRHARATGQLDESRYLDPIRDVLARGLSPGQRIIAQTTEMVDVIERLDYNR